MQRAGYNQKEELFQNEKKRSSLEKQKDDDLLTQKDQNSDKIENKKEE